MTAKKIDTDAGIPLSTAPTINVQRADTVVAPKNDVITSPNVEPNPEENG
jgi:hypothetical protein